MKTKPWFWGVALVLGLGLFNLGNLQAKEAKPMATDPELEKQVKAIAEELRCLVCQNQTIAASDAGLAVDLKNQVREMVAKGKSEEEIVDFMVQRYGDFVRYRPPVKSTTYLLWGGPFIFLLLGALILYTVLRNKKVQVEDAPLSEAENERLKAVLTAKEKGVGEVKSS